MIKVQDLTKTYENGVEALRGVSFDTPECGMIAVVGSSGCGKSTLLNILSGIDDKSGGEIYFDGEVRDPKEVKSDFATIYQDYKLIENITVIDNILVARDLTASDYPMEQIDSLLGELGILECKDEKVLSLSGGQKQRTAIARALVQRPKVIFADEPTGNLDSKNSENIFGLLRDLSKEMLIIVVTHDVDTVRKYADRIIRLQDGTVLSDEIIHSDDQSHHTPVKAIGTKRKKGSLSMHTAAALAIAFNKSKVGRRVMFMVISTLLLLIMTVVCNWAVVDYESMVLATYDKQNGSNMAVASYLKSTDVPFADTTFSVTQYENLTPIMEYLQEKKNVNSARVYWTNMVNIFDVPISPNSRYFDINDEMINLQEYAYYGGKPTRYIVTDDMKSLGMKLIAGRHPKEVGEVAIPRSTMVYFDALGGYRDYKKDENIALTPEQLLDDYDLYGVKVVGVFEDGVRVPDKFAEYPAANELYGPEEVDDETIAEAKSYTDGNILAQSVVISSAWEKVIEECWYIDGPQGASLLQGQYIHTSMAVNNVRYDNIGVAPANEWTQYVTGIRDVPQGTVLLSKRAAANYGVKDGDKVRLYTSLVRGNILPLGGAYVEDGIVHDYQEFTVRVDTGESERANWQVLYNDADYDMMMGGAVVQAHQIIYNMDRLSVSDLKAISNKAESLYGVSDTGHMPSMLEYRVDDGDDILDNYYVVRIIRNYIMIALSAVLAIILGILLYNTISIIISAKANDLLILKSMGAGRLDYLKVYGIFTLGQLLIELVIGVGVGIGLVYLLDLFLKTMFGTPLVVILPLMPMAILLTVLLAVLASVISLTFNICSISDKNLRKAFQKTKE